MTNKVDFRKRCIQAKETVQSPYHFFFFLLLLFNLNFLIKTFFSVFIIILDIPGAARRPLELEYRH